MNHAKAPILSPVALLHTEMGLVLHQGNTFITINTIQALQPRFILVNVSLRVDHQKEVVLLDLVSVASSS